MSILIISFEYAVAIILAFAAEDFVLADLALSSV